MRSGRVLMHGVLAGYIVEDEAGYAFTYDEAYLADRSAPAISLTMPKREESYVSPTMLPFFDGLIPEGWVLELATDQWKLDPRDRMGLLIAVCEDTIGAVQVFNESTP